MLTAYWGYSGPLIWVIGQRCKTYTWCVSVSLSVYNSTVKLLTDMTNRMLFKSITLDYDMKAHYWEEGIPKALKVQITCDYLPLVVWARAYGESHHSDIPETCFWLQLFYNHNTDPYFSTSVKSHESSSWHSPEECLDLSLHFIVHPPPPK